MANRCVIGVDLGGTNVRAAAVADDGSFVGPRISNSSEAEKGAEATFEAIARTVREAAEGARMAPKA
ncbi:MAG: ROK family protein, partial [Fimbriimonadaceae bacterium]